MDAMDATVPRRSIVDRMRGAAMFDVATYEEVEADTSATGQAAIVVLLSAVGLAAGMLWRGGPGIITGLVSGLLNWILWSGVTYLIGTRVFHGTATWGELLRTLGFAQAPGILFAVAIIPGLGWITRIIVSLWLLGTGIVAIRQALDVDTGKAIMVAICGWLAVVVASWVLAGIFGSALF